LRKALAQAGVLLFLTSYVVPYLGFFGLPILLLPAAAFVGLLLLLLGAITPSGQGETFGSMWPLVGYDNAIDALYVRGPWLMRFQEMEDLDKQRNVTIAMGLLFERRMVPRFVEASHDPESSRRLASSR